MNLKNILMASVAMTLVACAQENTDNAAEEEQVPVAEIEMSDENGILPNVPDGAQAMSLLGKPLFPREPSQAVFDNLIKAKADYDADPDNADNIIWYGRRVAYTGDYRRAIEIFTEGIEKFPTDARMYRHRGHRYISIREFDRALSDYQEAERLIQGTEDKIEPDGVINPAGIFLTSTHSNIYYHLGLSYYLKQDWENALAAFKAGQELGLNDDNIVSTGHWIYMILRRMGREEEAQASVQNIHKDMTIVENMSYHNLTLMYKGEIPPEELVNIDPNDPSGAAVAYGVANWFLYNGEKERAYDLMERFMETDAWSAFGFIGAEVDLSIR